MQASGYFLRKKAATLNMLRCKGQCERTMSGHASSPVMVGRRVRLLSLFPFPQKGDGVPPFSAVQAPHEALSADEVLGI
jgi:hypothetical protein